MKDPSRVLFSFALSLLLAFWPSVSMAKILKYKCKETNLIVISALDSLRKSMILEIDPSRPSLSLTKTSYFFVTIKSTVHSDSERAGDGISIKSKVYIKNNTMFAEGILFGVYGTTKFEFTTNKLTFSPTLELPWECSPI